MKVSEVLTRNIKYVSRGTSLEEAAKLMKDHDCGSIPVADGDKLVGMVTDRDIVIRCLADGKNPLTVSAEECMSSGVLYCYDDQDVEEVLANMGQQAVRRLPVVDRNKNLVGIVSFGDLSAACKDKARCGEAMEQIREAA